MMNERFYSEKTGVTNLNSFQKEFNTMCYIFKYYQWNIKKSICNTSEITISFSVVVP